MGLSFFSGLWGGGGGARAPPPPPPRPYQETNPDGVIGGVNWAKVA